MTACTDPAELAGLLQKTPITRRTVLVSTLSAGFAAAVQPVSAQTLATDTTGLEAGEVKIPTPDGEIPAYRARPAGAGAHATVLVVQEIFGVHEHIKDVCRRFAKQGYCAVAPELYARQGDVSKYTDFRDIVSNVVSKVPDAQVMSDLDAAVRWADSNEPSPVTDTFGWTNMTTFANRGGRMLLYHGVSDPLFSALDTVDYYNRLVATYGSADAVERWSRLFLVPGMGHCGGGSLTTDSFDLLTPLVDWVERGIAPDRVVATRNAEPRLARPLCPYPRYAHYTGRGDPQQAVSFECREP